MCGFCPGLGVGTGDLGLGDRAGSGSLGILLCLDVNLGVLVLIGIVEDVAVALGETVESVHTKVDRLGQSRGVCGVGLLRLVFGSVKGVLGFLDSLLTRLRAVGSLLDLVENGLLGLDVVLHLLLGGIGERLTFV